MSDSGIKKSLHIGLAGIADDFPIHQWDNLLPQTILTLNLLQQANIAPNVLAYAYHHGNFDYDQMPIAPMGCAVQFHVKPNCHQTWGEHSMDGWYLQTSPKHYRCWTVWTTKSHTTQISVSIQPCPQSPPLTPSLPLLLTPILDQHVTSSVLLSQNQSEQRDELNRQNAISSRSTNGHACQTIITTPSFSLSDPW